MFFCCYTHSRKACLLESWMKTHQRRRVSLLLLLLLHQRLLMGHCQGLAHRSHGDLHETCFIEHIQESHHE